MKHSREGAQTRRGTVEGKEREEEKLQFFFFFK